jgi:acetyl esterase/lipase
LNHNKQKDHQQTNIGIVKVKTMKYAKLAAIFSILCSVCAHGNETIGSADRDNSKVAPKPETSVVAQRIKLWPQVSGVVTGKDTERDPTEPTLDIYLAPTATAEPLGIVVLPGGGYSDLMMKYEGKRTAEFYNKHNISVFVVRYRHAPRYHYPVPLDDALRAMRIVRSRAAEFHLAPDHIGVIGFSAGGHLASMVATRFDTGNPQAKDAIDRVSSRPDFAILVYPVITFVDKPFVHHGSMVNLIGKDESLKSELSSELHMRKDTPPVFLVHGGEDTVVPPENSLLFAEACRRAGGVALIPTRASWVV